MKLSSLFLFGLLLISLSFSSLSTDGKKSQSDAYWRGEARPFAIISHSQTPDGILHLEIQNIALEPYVTTNISAAGGLYGDIDSRWSYSSGLLVAPGEMAKINVNMPRNCNEGSPYEYFVNFTYSDADGSNPNQKEIGIKTIYGKCHTPSFLDLFSGIFPWLPYVCLIVAISFVLLKIGRIKFYDSYRDQYLFMVKLGALTVFAEFVLFLLETLFFGFFVGIEQSLDFYVAMPILNSLMFATPIFTSLYAFYSLFKFWNEERRIGISQSDSFVVGMFCGFSYIFPLSLFPMLELMLTIVGMMSGGSTYFILDFIPISVVVFGTVSLISYKFSGSKQPGTPVKI